MKSAIMMYELTKLRLRNELSRSPRF